MQASTTANQVAFYKQQFDTLAPTLRQKLLRIDLGKALAKMPDVSHKVMEKLQSGNNRLAIETLLTEIKTSNCWDSFFAFLQSLPELAPFYENFKYTPSAEAPKQRNYMRVKDGIVRDLHGNVIPEKQFPPGTAIGILIDSSCTGVVLNNIRVDGVNESPHSQQAPSLPEKDYTYNLQPGEPLTLPTRKKRCVINCIDHNNITLGSHCESIIIDRVSNSTVTIGEHCHEVHIILYYQSHVIIQDSCRNILIERMHPNCTYSLGNNCEEIFIDRGKIC